MKDIDILLVIMNKGGQARYRDIMDGLQKSSINNRLRQLEKKGYIRRIVISKERPPIVKYVITRNGMNHVESVMLEIIKAYMVVRPKRLKELLELMIKECPKYIDRLEKRRKRR